MLGASQGELRLALYGQNGSRNRERAEVATTATASATDETTVPGGLPASTDTLAKIESYKVPDKAISLQQLARIKPPPAKQNSAPIQVPVYRAAEVQHGRSEAVACRCKRIENEDRSRGRLRGA
jgi:pilus assembly protein CpaB